jgi:CRISPR/Cas system CSM-associated protein Csm3 (group 7 of RAMP superfamily)
MPDFRSIYMFEVVNLSPLVVNRGSGNYLKSADYIPASSIIGAILSTEIPANLFNKEKYKIESGLSVTDATPVDKMTNELNPPSLITLSTKYTNGLEKIVDATKPIVEYITGKKPVGYQNIRLKKGPRFWKIEDNKIERVSGPDIIQQTLLTLDDKTLTVYTKEKEGLLAHIQAIAPGCHFAFEVTGEQSVVEEFAAALKEGLYVGALRSKGYGLIKLIGWKEKSVVQREPLKLEGDSDEYYVLSVYGNLDYEYLLKIREKLKKYKEVYTSTGLQEIKRWDYNVFKKRWVVKSGSVLIYTNAEKDIYDLEHDSLINAKGGKIIVNHPVITINE